LSLKQKYVPLSGCDFGHLVFISHVFQLVGAFFCTVSFNAPVGARDASPAYCGNNMYMDRETASTSSSAFDVLRDVAPVAPPPVVGGESF